MTHALRFVEQVAARQRSSISADTCHTLCVQPDGVAYAWGAHELGPEGPVGWVEGDEAEVAEECWLAHLGLDVRCGPPVRLPARLASLGVGHAIREVAAGYCHSLFLCAAGQVWACGVGEHGRLGLGDELATPTTTVPSPTRIKALSGRRMVQVAAGGFQSLALCDQGRTYSWGWGESGSTGHNNREHQHTPKVISALIGTRVVQASAGSGHSLFVDEEGSVFACGHHLHGKLGLGPALREDSLWPQKVEFKRREREVCCDGARVRIVQASAWHDHSLAVSDTGTSAATLTE